MSLIKLINNKNVLQKIPVRRLPEKILRKRKNLPSYTLLENSPTKLSNNNTCALSNNVTNDLEKNIDEALNVEYTTLEKCLRYLFGVDPKKRDDHGTLQSRELHHAPESGKGAKGSASHSHHPKPLPRLLYIQNPMVWITNKLDFRYLRKWDPQFSESEFTRGARQAVSTITDLVSKDMFDSLKPLLTKNALLNLRKDVEILWANDVRRNISLAPSDVQLVIPRKLHFRNVSNKRYCDIDMVFIALKWLETVDLKNPPLVFIDIIVRFHRNYSDDLNPDWTISAFKVRRFNVVPQK